MKIIDMRSDGSLDAELESKDGTIRSAVQIAKDIAIENQQVVHFEFNDWPIALGPNTDLDLILRLYDSKHHLWGGLRQIGPDPDPATVPEWDHGTFVVEIPSRG